ncbi:MAG: glycosyltransferase, partial [Bdellovibrionaceae bacterium]|nr:glycosyltransferase [Pseudobdellovibrionaceae bacterium]
DDRSPKGDWEKIQAIHQRDPRFRGIQLSRNFGQHLAITAGLSEAQGQYVAVMDCDLQDPPEVLPKMLEMAEAGNKVVLGRRQGKKHSPLRKTQAAVYSFLVRRLSGLRFDQSVGTLSVLHRQVVDGFNQFMDCDRHYLYILNWLGFDPTFYEYKHKERFSGKSSYSLVGLVRHAVSGLLFQTTVLLRYMIYLGFLITIMGMSLAGYFVYLYMQNTPPAGWTSLVVIMLVLGGFTIACLGVVGLYVGRIFYQVRQRPLFVIDKRV